MAVMGSKKSLLLTSLAVVMLVLVLVNILLSLGNQALQAEVNGRQQFISQSIQLEGLSREIVAVLANLALQTNDEQLRKLLESQGIGFAAPGSAAPSKSK
jgi:hypothetical protein